MRNSDEEPILPSDEELELAIIQSSIVPISVPESQLAAQQLTRDLDKMFRQDNDSPQKSQTSTGINPTAAVNVPLLSSTSRSRRSLSSKPSDIADNVPRRSPRKKPSAPIIATDALSQRLESIDSIVSGKNANNKQAGKRNPSARVRGYTLSRMHETNHLSLGFNITENLVFSRPRRGRALGRRLSRNI